jgi:hypothetical protein
MKKKNLNPPTDVNLNLNAKVYSPEELAKMKTTVLVAAAKRLDLPDNTLFQGFFVYQKENQGKKGLYKIYVFRDAGSNQFFYVSGKALDQAEFIPGKLYGIYYQGTSKTQAGQNFKNYIVTLMEE